MLTSRHHDLPPLGSAWTDEIVSGCARRRSEGDWTVVFYDFPVQASGLTLYDALDAAGEELVVYIVTTTERLGGGVTVEQLKCPIGRRQRVKCELGSFVSRAWRLIAEDAPLDVYPINLPLAQAARVADEATSGASAGDDDSNDEAALMAEGYRELSGELLAFATQTAHAAAEALPQE